MHQAEDLINIFNECFRESHQTELVRGDDEPLYLPATEEDPVNKIIFAHGFFASALHECSHWLIAGQERRKLVDFGYWYEPDGRTAEQQALFQVVEVKPQAMEWILSVAAGHRFRLSFDNLNGAEGDKEAFKKAVYEQVMLYCAQGISTRANTLRQALCQFYGTPSLLNKSDFALTDSI